ncbi:MAG: hypothetical protein ACMZ64_11080 [Oleiphilus sp.]
MKDTLFKSIIGLSALHASSMALAITVSFTEIPGIEPKLNGEKPLAISNDGTVAMMNTDFELLNWNAITGTEFIYATPEYNGTNAIWPTISEDGNTILFSSFLQGTANENGSPEHDYYYHDGAVTIYDYSSSGQLVPNLYAMSGDGSVMGGYHTSWPGKWPSSLTPENQFTKHLNAPEDTVIAAINMDGSKFVSHLHFNGISSAQATAYVWETDGTPIASDIPMAVKGFSAAGDVVLGAISDQSLFGPKYTVLWNANTNQYTDINDMPYPQAFSDDTSIVVGNSSKKPYTANNMMLIWDNINGVRNLNDVLTSYGVSLSGWSDVIIQNISRDGTKMVGSGINPDGQSRAFIINITEECSPFL